MSTIQAAALAISVLILIGGVFGWTPRGILRGAARTLAWSCIALGFGLALIAFNLMNWSE